MAKRMISSTKEANVNWFNDSDEVSVTLYERKYKKQIEKLIEDHPDEVHISAVNEDGTIVARLPKKYVHINFGERAKREMTEDQKAAAAERLRVAREKKAEMNE